MASSELQSTFVRKGSMADTVTDWLQAGTFGGLEMFWDRSVMNCMEAS